MKKFLSKEGDFDESESLFLSCGDFWFRNLRHIALNVNFNYDMVSV